VNGRAHLHADIVWIFLELEREFSERHGQADGGFQRGELVADAFASAGAERDEGVIGRDLVRVEAGE